MSFPESGPSCVAENSACARPIQDLYLYRPHRERPSSEAPREQTPSRRLQVRMPRPPAGHCWQSRCLSHSAQIALWLRRGRALLAKELVSNKGMLLQAGGQPSRSTRRLRVAFSARPSLRANNYEFIGPLQCIVYIFLTCDITVETLHKNLLYVLLNSSFFYTQFE